MLIIYNTLIIKKVIIVNNKRNRIIIIFSIILLVAIILGGGYIWYSGRGINKRTIELTPMPSVSYEWQEIAASYNIQPDLIFQKLKSLVLPYSKETSLVPSYYVVRGRLSYQDEIISEEYNLADQADLLSYYVRTQSKSSATKLRDRIVEYFNFEETPRGELISFLDSYLYFYEAYGTNKDYARIEELVNILFEEGGTLAPYELRVAHYEEEPFVSLSDPNDDTYDQSSLGSRKDESEETFVTLEGVEISAINLRLIMNLEKNKLLPEGSYDKNLNIVLESRASENIPIFAYAYISNEEGVSYIYSKLESGAMDFPESIRTTYNLSMVDEVPYDVYSYLKSQLFGEQLGISYYFVSGRVEGEEANYSYIDILGIAIYMDDIDLFSEATSRIGGRVATLNTSDAYRMVFIEEDGRFVFSSSENIKLSLLLL